jgi:hypothetical protein
MFKIRLEVLLVLAATAIVANKAFALALALAIAVHELGHAVARFLVGRGPFRIELGLGGGQSYLASTVQEELGSARQAVVLLGGPVASGLAGGLFEHYAIEPAASLQWMWLFFQLAPFPSMDGGQLLRGVFDKDEKHGLLAWRACWGLGLVWIAVWWMVQPSGWVPGLWLLGLSMLLGRAEGGRVWHRRIYRHWESGLFRQVLTEARRCPDYLLAIDRRAIGELALLAAMELDLIEEVERFARWLPRAHPVRIVATIWLLKRGSEGARFFAEAALFELDTEHVRPEGPLLEHYQELVFCFARFEAERHQFDSSLGLLERAKHLGFEDLERIEVEPSFVPIAQDPRFKAL